MTENRLFYYPYATMFDAQLPLLKTAALYFDELVMLDPRDATWDRVGPDPNALDEVLLLERHGLLERVSPTAVFEDYSSAFVQAVRDDVRDPGFLQLCDDQARRTGRHLWSLALAKIPGDLFADGQLRSLLGDLAPPLANEMAHRIDQYIEHQQALSYLPGNEDSGASSRELQQAAVRSMTNSGKTPPVTRSTIAASGSPSPSAKRS